MLDPSLRARLVSQASSFRAWIADADPLDLAWTPPTGKWSALLNLAHVARHHEVMQDRLAQIMLEDDPALPRYDEASDPEWPRWLALDPDQVWPALESRRSAMVSVADGYTPAQLVRTGVHSKFGRMSVPRWLEFFLVHEAHHLYVVLQRLAEARSARR